MVKRQGADPGRAGTVIFDMDGVLVDADDSYGEAVVQTVRHFSGHTVTRSRIQDYKLAGGWNNDWALTQRMLFDLGTPVAYEAVVAEFNRRFFGQDGCEGLIWHERWLPTAGVLERLAARFALALFTGRMRCEAAPTLQRFAPGLRFDPQVCADDVQRGKPDPEGLRLIMHRPGPRRGCTTRPVTAAWRSSERPAGATRAKSSEPLWFVGDTVDDARSARAAGVPFIAVVAPAHERRRALRAAMRQEGAIAVVDDVNQIEAVLP